MAYGRVDNADTPEPKEADNSFNDSDFYSKSVKPRLSGSKKATKASAASKDLGDAEKNATNHPITNTGAGAASALGAEAGKAGFLNNVQGLMPSKAKSKGKGKLAKSAPIGVVIALLIGVSAAMLGGPLTLGANLMANIKGVFGFQGVSTAIRSKQFLKFQTGDVKDFRKTSVFGTKFKLSSKQKAKLKSQGIEAVEVKDVNSKTRTVFLFDDGSSKKTLIAPDEKTAAKFQDMSKVQVGDGDVEIGSVMSFDKAYTDIADFFNGYNKAARTWKGMVGAWFDSITLRFLQSNNLTRNRFQDFQKRVKEEYEGNTKKAAIETLHKGADEVETGQKTTELSKKANDDGSTSTVAKTDETKVKIRPGGHTNVEIQAKLKELEAKYKKSASSMAEMGANIACGIAQFIGGVGLVVAAAESVQLYQIISGFAEAIDKVEAGEGSDSPIHVLMTALVEPHSNVAFSIDDEGNFLAKAVDAKDDEEYEAVDNATIKEEQYSDKSAMQSEAIAALYGNYKINQDDKSVSSFTIGGNLINNIFTAIGATAFSFVACSLAKAATALIGAVTDVVTIAGCILSLGIGCVVDAVIEGLGSIGGSLAFAAGFAAATAILYPMLTKWLTRDLISDLGGEDLGNALVSGGNMYLGRNHLTGGGSLTGKDGLLAFEVEHQKVIADNAKYERANLSPFDITSQYTFLGSLFNKFASLYTANQSASGILTTIGNITRNSLASILPSASAAVAANMIEGVGDCPYLDSIDAVGDAFCNPYIVDDIQSPTINMHPGEVIDTVDSYGGFENSTEDDFTIDKESNLARYIVYCNERQSQFGVADQNIANDFMPLDKTVDEIVGDSGVGKATGTVANSAIGVIPVVGDLIDVGQNTNQLAHTGWITGGTCVANNKFNDSVGKASATPEWEEVQYYQRYVEDQRLMESIDPDYTSAVTAFLDEYYTEHPIDYSYEGILARRSGLTKENVIAILDVVDYMNYIANYNPSTRHKFTDENEQTRKTYVDTENNVAIDSETVITQYAIVYNDIRNRTATV